VFCNCGVRALHKLCAPSTRSWPDCSADFKAWWAGFHRHLRRLVTLSVNFCRHDACRSALAAQQQCPAMVLPSPAEYKSSSNSPTSNCSPVAIGSYRMLDVGGSASPHAQATGPGSSRQHGIFSSSSFSASGQQQQPPGSLHSQSLSLPSPSASGLSRSGHAWDHNGGIDTGSSSSSSQEQQQHQQHQHQRMVDANVDGSRMQPLEDRSSPHVSRSASSSSLANASPTSMAAAAGAGYGPAGSILGAARSPRSLAVGGISSSGGSFTRGSSGTGSSAVEADMQKR